MGNALRDQLLKAGLVNDKQIKQAAKDKQKENRQKQGQKQTTPDSATLQAQRIAAEKAQKAARDLELNRQRQEAAAQKAQLAQLKQLIEAHRLPATDGEIPYNFADRGKVKRIYVNQEVRDRIVAGRLVIVSCEGRYDLVPPDIAQRIRERNPEAIVLWNSPGDSGGDGQTDDPYASFTVPDDLVW